MTLFSLFMFPGHAYPLSAIQWRTAEDYLVLGYSDEAAFVWQVRVKDASILA